MKHIRLIFKTKEELNKDFPKWRNKMGYYLQQYNLYGKDITDIAAKLYFTWEEVPEVVKISPNSSNSSPFTVDVDKNFLKHLKFKQSITVIPMGLAKI